MKKLIALSAVALLFTSCAYVTPDGKGGAAIVKDWAVAVQTYEDTDGVNKIDWIRLTPPVGTVLPENLTAKAGIDSEGIVSLRIYRSVETTY